MNYSTATSNQTLKTLNACIQVEEARISRRVTIPRQIVFRLNADVLAQIEQLTAKNRQLKLSKSQLATLRYYTLLNAPFNSEVNSIQQGLSPLNFTTDYLFPDKQNLRVVRTQINLEGQISQQIQQDLWHSPQLLTRVVNAHHWLIKQILIQLPLTTPRYILRLFKALLFLVSIIIAIYLWYFFHFNNLVEIIIIIAWFYCLKRYLIAPIKRQVKSHFLKAISTGFLANTAKKRQLACSLLKTLV